jgi:hypothetical protein
VAAVRDGKSPPAFLLLRQQVRIHAVQEFHRLALKAHWNTITLW